MGVSNIINRNNNGNSRVVDKKMGPERRDTKKKMGKW